MGALLHGSGVDVVNSEANEGVNQRKGANDVGPAVRATPSWNEWVRVVSWRNTIIPN